MKLGISSPQSIKFTAKRLGVAIVLITWLLSVLACNAGYIHAADLTATAGGGYPSKVTPQPVVLSPTLDSPTQADPTQPIPADLETPEVLPTSKPVILELPPTVTPIPTRPGTSLPPLLYYTQAGDTLGNLAIRFGVQKVEITSPAPLVSERFLNPGQLLVIPNRITEEISPATILMPDSEVVYSPSALDFNLKEFIDSKGGYLATYREYLSTGWMDSSQVIERVAIENSINPRMLLAIVEFNSHWVTGQPTTLAETDYPIGYIEINHKGLYKQLSWAVQKFSLGYYGWRAGLVTGLTFKDYSSVRLAPTLNAGTVALQYFYANLNTRLHWNQTLYSENNFSKTYEALFGNPWIRAQTVEPLFPPGLTQPDLVLPFQPGIGWSLSGGPHSAWGPDGALSAIDFAPSSTTSGCYASTAWVTAVAPGLVVRVGNGIVMVDLDGDGHEQTGWSFLYMHITSLDRVEVGQIVDTNDRIGHPSCDGGFATGTHTHIARKYNGEWILADGPIPFNLSGWIAHSGGQPYLGFLTRGDQVVNACSCGSHETIIHRDSGTLPPGP